MQNRTDHDRIIKELAILVNKALPLAQRLESDEFTPEERERFRSLTAIQRSYSNAVFELNNLLSRLCGESARRLLSRDPKVVAKEKRRLQLLSPPVQIDGDESDA